MAIKKRTVHNSHPRRLAAEKSGLALMLSGSYVLTALDEDEWETCQRTDFSRCAFRSDASIVVTNELSSSKRGKLARLAYLSAREDFAQYKDPVFPGHSSAISL